MQGSDRLPPMVLPAEDVHRWGFRRLPLNLFRDWGFDVIEARHGLEAWHQARKCKGRIELLIAEQDLPFMDGWELAAHVRTLFPPVKVLLIVQEAGAFYHVSPSLAVLHEPLEHSMLMNKLKSLLGSPILHSERARQMVG